MKYPAGKLRGFLGQLVRIRFPVLELYLAQPGEATRRCQVQAWLPDFLDADATTELQPDGSARLICHTRPRYIVSAVQETDRIEAGVPSLCRALPENAGCSGYRPEPQVRRRARS